MGRPKKTEEPIHKVVYYQPKPEMAAKALEKVLRDRLLKAYKNLFKLAHGIEPNQRDMQIINRAVERGSDIIV